MKKKFEIIEYPFVINLSIPFPFSLALSLSLSIYIYIYIYMCVCVCVCVCVCIIYWQHFFINTNLVEHNINFLSTYFLVDPFIFLYCRIDFIEFGWN